MWKRLSDPTATATYLGEARSLPELAALIDALRKEEFANSIFVTTSLGNMLLTTAPDFMQAENFSAVSVLPRAPGFAVSFFPKGSRQACAGRRCRASELQSTVELFLLRLILELSASSE
jgi:hypothetical protein